jgi:hypothetical protein
MIEMNRIAAFVAIALLMGCSGPTKKPEPSKENPQEAFFDRFKQFEGKKFFGKQTYIAEGMNSWEKEELEMYVRECNDSIVYVPFRVGANTSRTWMFILEKEHPLRFRHDHRHADGTPEDLNLYGGYAANDGTSLSQVFPADDFTCKMLERICDNEWMVEFSEDLSLFTYSLKKKGVLVFKAEFDLTKSF